MRISIVAANLKASMYSSSNLWAGSFLETAGFNKMSRPD